MIASIIALQSPLSISSTLAVKCFASGLIYFPVKRLARSATCGCEMPAGQRDEMGRLCKEFERMKEQLAENNHL